MARAARAAFGAQIPADVVVATSPGRLRRAYLESMLDVEHAGAYRFEQHSPELKRLLVGFALMDRMRDRLRFGAYYAGLRIRDTAAELGRSSNVARRADLQP